MALATGTRLGPYEILAVLGAGGMGEVYRARDTRLDRTVAIKVLPPEVSADPDRRARFEREARTISTLNHPHICTLHDVGDHDGVPYLVMEHLAGETLADRLKNGPLPLDRVLVLSAQIADALSAAHKHGIVHRDLKPANVMLTKTGTKLLDFGLAKLRPQEGVRLEADPLATVSGRHDVTAVGMLVGTVPYMAPEQVEGRETDARTDLWALGCLIYEMVTGQRAFEGTTPASLVGAILAKEPPPLASRQPLTPPPLELLVRRCLAKDPERRWDSAHDLADALRWMREMNRTAATGAPARRQPGLRTVLAVARGLLLVAVGAGLMWVLRPMSPRIALTHPSLDVRPAEELGSADVPEPTFTTTRGGSRTALVWTPDGQAILFVGRRGGVQRLYGRRLDEPEARPLNNTEGAQVPAISVDGRWVAFWAGAAIKKVPVGGGPVTDLASGLADPPWGLAWDDRGRLFFGRGSGGSIWMIPPEGAPVAVTTVGEAEVAHILPWPLPDGGTLLYTVRKRQWSWGDEEVVAQTLATGTRKVLLKDAADARYVPSGHLLFLRRGVLFAVPFDAARLEMRGAPVAVLDTVAQALTASNTDHVTGAGQFAVAGNGALAWVPGPVIPYPDATLVVVDRRGEVSPLPAPVRSYGSAARVARNGRHVAVTVRTLSDAGVWVYDAARGTMTRLAEGGEASTPVWSPDGGRVAFEWLAAGRRALVVQPADGTAPPQTLVKGVITVSSFTPDGRHVAAVKDSHDIVLVNVEPGQTDVQPLAKSQQHAERWPEFSPDGRWLAYGSEVSGRFEVYVRPYPGHGPAEPVSVDGGWSPAWHPNGRELFFVSVADPEGRRRLMAVEFAPGSPPYVGAPRALFTFDPRELRFACTPVRCYDVAADGQRFYVTQTHTPPPPPAVTHISLTLNWLEELEAKVPAGTR